MPEPTADTLDLTAFPFWQWDSVMPRHDTLPAADVGFTLDSLLPHREMPEVQCRPSLFSHHTLAPAHDTLLPRPETATPVWVFVALLLLAGILVLYYRLRKIKVAQLLHALVNHRVQERIVRDCNLTRNISMLPMGMLAVAAICLPVHAAVLPHTGPLGYLLLSMATALLFVLRNAILRLLGNTFEHRPEVAAYISSSYFFHLTEATLVTALLPLFFYMPGARHSMALVIAIVVAAAFLTRFFRGSKIIFAQANGSSFYLFYYLCIVELIPVLAIIKWIIVQ